MPPPSSNTTDVPRRPRSCMHVCGIALANVFPPPTAGSRPPLLFAMRERVPAKWRLSRCTNACTTKSGGASAPRGWVTRVQRTVQRHATDNPQQACIRAIQERGASAPRGYPLRMRGGDRQHNVGVSPQTVRKIADYGRLARRISPELARPCDGLRAAGEADLPQRISPQPARPCDGLRTMDDLLAESLHNLPDHAKDCGL
jgi:hypothetical protein